MPSLTCRKDRAKAVEILVKDLKVFSAFNEDLFKEITQLLTLENFRYGKASLENCICWFFGAFRLYINLIYRTYSVDCGVCGF